MSTKQVFFFVSVTVDTVLAGDINIHSWYPSSFTTQSTDFSFISWPNPNQFGCLIYCHCYNTEDLEVWAKPTKPNDNVTNSCFLDYHKRAQMLFIIFKGITKLAHIVTLLHKQNLPFPSLAFLLPLSIGTHGETKNPNLKEVSTCVYFLWNNSIVNMSSTLSFW